MNQHICSALACFVVISLQQRSLPSYIQGSVLYSHEGTLTWPQHSTQPGSVLYSHEETLAWPQHSTQSGVGVVLT